MYNQPGDILDERVGTEISGFRIEAEIGRGGMGVVYLAEQSSPRRKVALKVLSPDLVRDPAFRERFARESEAAASVEHPNVLPVYGAGEADGELYIAMRYVEGEDLRTLLDREGPLAPERAGAICAQVADALQEAHDHGLVHRDVKPGNILIAGDRAYLTDFGLIRRSKLETDLTKTGQFMGTVDYVAPEQIKGEEVDGRADVYSLGCVLYECLTGVSPFHKETEVATLYAHLEDPPPKPSAKRPELPRALDEIVAKATAKQPDDRYTTASAFAADIVRELGVTGGGHALLESSMVHRRRRRQWLIAAGGLASLAVLAMGLMLATRSAPPATVPPGKTIGVSRIDESSNQVTLSEHDSSWGWHMDAAEGALWETGPDGLVKRNEATGRVERILDLGGVTHTVAAGFGAIWVTVAGGGTASLVRIDPATDQVIKRVDVSPPTGLTGIVWVAADKTDVWVFNGSGNLSKVDPVSNKILGRYQVVQTGGGLTTGAGAVWVSDILHNDVVKVDPHTGKTLETIHMTGEPDWLAFVGGLVWVEDFPDATITPIDPSVSQAGASIAAPHNLANEVAGLGSLWVAADGSVMRINPLTRDVKEIQIGFAASTVAPDERTGAVWVLHQPDGWGPGP